MSIERSEALELLRCDADVLEQLVLRGLASDTSQGLERFDYHDLANVALYSRSRRSLPETAQRFLLRFAEGPSSQWTVRKRWDVTWSLRCSSPRCDEGRWLVSLPDRGLRGEVDGDPPADPPQRIYREGPAVDLRFSAELAGSRQVLIAPGLRDLFTELVYELHSGRFRYQWMPPQMRTDVDAAVANGTLDCAAASLLLVSRCQHAGYTARSRVSVVLGLIGVEHVVAEVLDADGAWKTLDPVFAYLAGRSDRVADEFADFCAGSTGNRMLMWCLPATAPLASHACGQGSRRHASEFAASVSGRAT